MKRRKSNIQINDFPNKIVMFRHSFAFALPVASERTEMR